MSPEQLATLIAAFAAAVVAILAAVGKLWLDLHQYGRAVNGRMDELLELTRVSSEARGKLGADPPVLKNR